MSDDPLGHEQLIFFSVSQLSSSRSYTFSPLSNFTVSLFNLQGQTLWFRLHLS